MMFPGLSEPQQQTAGKRSVAKMVVTHLMVLWICLSVSLTTQWNVLTKARTAIPTTQNGSATVPLFNTWTILWNCSAVTQRDRSYWNAPIFHPHHGTFAYSEPQPITLFLAPLRSAQLSPAMIYNIYLISSLTLNGYLAYILLTVLQCRFAASAIGAIAMVLLPIAHDQLDVMQLVPLWPSLWTISALLKLRLVSMTPPVRRWTFILFALQPGLAFAVAAAVSLHHSLFLAILLSIATPALFWHPERKRLLAALIGAAFVAGVCVLPWAVPMKQLVDQEKFQREEALVAQLSATPSDFLRISNRQLLPWTTLSGIRPWYLSPGLARTLMALGVLAVLPITLVRNRQQVIPIVFLGILTLAAACLSLGTNLQIGGWQPWQTLSHVVPGMSQVRSAFRFGYFYQIAVVVLACVSLNAMGTLRQTQRNRRFIGLLLAVVAFVVAFEVLPVKPRLVNVPNAATLPDWAKLVSQELSRGQGIIVLPYVAGSGVNDFEITTRLMVALADSALPMANGYSGFFPDSHYEWQAFLEKTPDAAAFSERMRLERLEIVVCLAGSFRTSFKDSPELLSSFEILFQDEDREIVLLRRKRQAD